MTARQTWRSRVDFPPILGPVSSMNGLWFVPPSLTSLGTKEVPPAKVSPSVGWRKPLASNQGATCSASLNMGVQVGPSPYVPAEAMLTNTSTSVHAWQLSAPAFCHILCYKHHARLIPSDHFPPDVGSSPEGFGVGLRDACYKTCKKPAWASEFLKWVEGNCKLSSEVCSPIR